MIQNIKVKGAREHNLKNIDIEFPRNKFIVITGLSGSGKSTLAFDTIYAEGQRRYVESLSSYARQFLGIMNKPDVDSIEGLSPAISIEQKTTSKNPRSTVGTVTEIYDYLRLLYARIGVSYCPKCNSAIKPQSAENIVNIIMSEKGKKIVILAPIVRGLKGTYEKVFEDLKKDGFARARINGSIYELDTIKDEVKLERYEKHYIEAVIDRVVVDEEDRLRISDGVEQALKFGKGSVIILDIELEEKLKQQNKTAKKELQRGFGETLYSSFGACPNHSEVVFEQLEPRHFSFNSPFGACPTCLGLGQQMEISPELIIPDKNLSIMDGAIRVYGKMDISWRAQQIGVVGKKFKFSIFDPINKFSDKQLSVLLYGTDEQILGKWSNGANMNMENGWEGIIPQTTRLYKQTESDYRKSEIEKYMVSKHCHTCRGKRLKDTILGVKIDEKNIVDVTDLSIVRAGEFFKQLDSKLNEKDKFIAKQILKEINERLSFLNNVGLSYLNLSRSAGTLSGGEAQRIRLATQIGSNLMGVLYVLDEPSIGLHQRDNEKLINTLHKLRDIGNTLIVVEHDEETIRSADYVVDLGPGAGVHGGYIVAKGTPKEIENNKKSITGDYLSGRKKIEIPTNLRKIGKIGDKKFRIGTDIDDVICNSFEFLGVDENKIIDLDYNNLLGIKPKELRKKNAEIFEKKYDQYTIYPQAKKYLKKLKQDGHKLFVITSRPEFSRDRTISWLEKEFGKDFFEEIVYTSRVNGKTKGDAAKILNLDYMIEDSQPDVNSLINNKINTFVYDKNWNKQIKNNTYVQRVNNWDEICEKIINKNYKEDYIELKGARENNLKNLDVKFPTKILCSITGVSGSGKSTLLNHTLMPALKKHFGEVYDKMGEHDEIIVPSDVQNMIVIDQSPIGKTPRSNPATYIKVFDDIRKIFASTKESKARGYREGRFSFNVKGGRCETCSGDGLIKIEMNFLPDVYVQCESCKGKRYNKDTLEILYKGKNIADILNMDVEAALPFFENHSSIKRKIQTLNDVGLGYIKLGQSSTTLSGGESQRIKLTKELAKFKKGHTVYILDEPTTGLHFEDVNKLIQVINKLVDKGNSIFVIEHNLDVIKCSDWIIDLGPEGGDGGGQIIAQGTPQDIAKVKESHTGRFLKKVLEN